MIGGMTIEDDATGSLPPAPSRAVRHIMLVLGVVCTIVGIAGLLLPLLPGTVFLLIAIWAFSHSSERFHDWLYHHPRFGRTLRDWRRYRVIPIKAKLLAITMMAGSFVYVAVTNDGWLVPSLVGAILASVAIWIVSRPSRAGG